MIQSENYAAPMSARRLPATQTWTAAEGRLASLRQHDLRDDFHAWFGASGRRYVASVFPVDPAARDAGLPAFDAFVLIPVVRENGRSRANGVVAVEWGSTRNRAVADATEAGVDEWHVHLLGTTRGEREAIAADLRAGAGVGRDRLLTA